MLCYFMLIAKWLCWTCSLSCETEVYTVLCHIKPEDCEADSAVPDDPKMKGLWLLEPADYKGYTHIIDV